MRKYLLYTQSQQSNEIYRQKMAYELQNYQKQNGETESVG